MKRKILSVFLACLLGLSLLYTTANAEETEAASEHSSEEMSEDVSEETSEGEGTETEEETPKHPKGKYIVMVPLLNFREGAGTNFDVVTVLSMGDKLILHEIDDDWAYASFGEQNGWVMIEYLEYVGYLDDYAVDWRVIDVSVHQGKVDWEKVKADGVNGVILRLGRRASVTRSIDSDLMFSENYRSAMDAGLHVGAYFFSAALNAGEAQEEARWLVDKIEKDNLKFDLPIFYDIELDDQAKLGKVICNEMVHAFCGYLLDKGYYPGVYSNLWWAKNVLDMKSFADYAVWIAHYSNNFGYKGRASMWQFTAKGRIDGIAGDVDINYCYVDFPKYISDKQLNHIIIEGEHIYGEWEIETESTCTVHGYESFACLHCNVVMGRRILPLKAHEPADEWVYAKTPTAFEDGELVLKCRDCDLVLKRQNVRALNSTHVHDFSSDWIITKEATCTSEGEKTLKCIDCDNEIISHFIERAAHEGGEWIVVSATCTEDGSRFLNCRHCDILLEYELLAATGHSIDEWIVTKEPSTTEFGERIGICQVCGETITEQIPKEQLKLLGDVNFDGEISATDARRILRASAKLEELNEEEAFIADVNSDGEVAAVDARLVLRMSAQLEPLRYA